ncbi:homeobox-like protein HDP1 isoform X2 [Physella acuta]|uniref:homeobox-like protein HDP1 isoform X2 n=1 Tax=Physella acuta TaxID=109671 RepID=UPI0027DCE806|nr:homeobox-like protein HDP1 isoform X2 [Physella acuta]
MTEETMKKFGLRFLLGTILAIVLFLSIERQYKTANDLIQHKVKAASNDSQEERGPLLQETALEFNVLNEVDTNFGLNFSKRGEGEGGGTNSSLNSQVLGTWVDVSENKDEFGQNVDAIQDSSQGDVDQENVGQTSPGPEEPSVYDVINETEEGVTSQNPEADVDDVVYENPAADPDTFLNSLLGLRKFLPFATGDAGEEKKINDVDLDAELGEPANFVDPSNAFRSFRFEHEEFFINNRNKEVSENKESDGFVEAKLNDKNVELEKTEYDGKIYDNDKVELENNDEITDKNDGEDGLVINNDNMVSDSVTLTPEYYEQIKADEIVNDDIDETNIDHSVAVKDGSPVNDNPLKKIYDDLIQVGPGNHDDADTQSRVGRIVQMNMLENQPSQQQENILAPEQPSEQQRHAADNRDPLRLLQLLQAANSNVPLENDLLNSLQDLLQRLTQRPQISQQNLGAPPHLPGGPPSPQQLVDPPNTNLVDIKASLPTYKDNNSLYQSQPINGTEYLDEQSDGVGFGPIPPDQTTSLYDDEFKKTTASSYLNPQYDNPTPLTEEEFMLYRTKPYNATVLNATTAVPPRHEGDQLVNDEKWAVVQVSELQPGVDSQQNISNQQNINNQENNNQQNINNQQNNNNQQNINSQQNINNLQNINNQQPSYNQQSNNQLQPDVQNQPPNNQMLVDSLQVPNNQPSNNQPSNNQPSNNQPSNNQPYNNQPSNNQPPYNSQQSNNNQQPSDNQPSNIQLPYNSQQSNNIQQPSNIQPQSYNNAPASGIISLQDQPIQKILQDPEAMRPPEERNQAQAGQISRDVGQQPAAAVQQQLIGQPGQQPDLSGQQQVQGQQPDLSGQQQQLSGQPDLSGQQQQLLGQQQQLPGQPDLSGQQPLAPEPQRQGTGRELFSHADNMFIDVPQSPIQNDTSAGNDDVITCPRQVKLAKTSHPITALVAFPGATTDWLRKILEQLTGEETDSIYDVMANLKSGNAASVYQMSKKIAIQTHAASDKNFERGVIVISNPYSVEEKHKLFRPRAIDWQRDYLWAPTYRAWLTSALPTYVLLYEDLVEAPLTELLKLAEFLGAPDRRISYECALDVATAPPPMVDDVRQIAGIYNRDRKRINANIDTVMEVAKTTHPEIIARLDSYKVYSYV